MAAAHWAIAFDGAHRRLFQITDVEAEGFGIATLQSGRVVARTQPRTPYIRTCREYEISGVNLSAGELVNDASRAREGRRGRAAAAAVAVGYVGRTGAPGAFGLLTSSYVLCVAGADANFESRSVGQRNGNRRGRTGSIGRSGWLIRGSRRQPQCSSAVGSA